MRGLTYELLATVPVSAMEIDNHTSTVETASILQRCHAFNVLVACLVQHVKDFRRRGTDGSAGNVSHRLGNIVVRSVEKDQHASALINDMNGAGLVQMSLGQCLHLALQNATLAVNSFELLLRRKALGAYLFDDKSANIMADEDERPSRVVESVLHEKSKKTITMLDESSVFVIHGEAVIVGEEHDATALSKAAGKDIPGPHLVTVGPGVPVHIVTGLNVETMDDDDARDGQGSKRESVTVAEKTKIGMKSSTYSTSVR